METCGQKWDTSVSTFNIFITHHIYDSLLNDHRFKNEITHSTKILKPAECCGGILADEMGMGKSLSLLALIIYTLHNQRSDNKENGYPSGQKGDIWSRATLIIAPKSSKSIILSLEGLDSDRSQ